MTVPVNRRGVGEGAGGESEVWVPKADPDGSDAVEVATCQTSEQLELIRIYC